MAFTAATFSPGSLPKGIGNQAFYTSSADNLAAVAGAGYFNSVAEQFKPQFMIDVIASDGGAIFSGTSIAGVVALTLLTI